MPGQKDIGQFQGPAPRVPTPSLVDGMAVQALDVDYSNGTLKPFREDRLVQTTGAGAKHLYVDDCCILANPTCADVAEQNVPCDRVYRTGFKPYPEVSTSTCGIWCRLGFPCLDVAPTMRVRQVTTLGQPTSYKQTDQKVIARQYFYTVSDDYNRESGPSPMSEIVIADWDTPATISKIQISAGDYCMTRLNLYSTMPTLDQTDVPTGTMDNFFKVAELPLGPSGTPGILTIKPTSFTHYPETDSVGEIFLQAHYSEPPEDLTDIAWWGTNQIAGLSGGDLHFSEGGYQHSWPRKDVMTFDAKALRFLAVNKTGYVFTCEAVEVVDLSQTCSRGQCRDRYKINEAPAIYGLRSVAKYLTGAVYASDQGLMWVQGQQVINLTSELMTVEQWRAMGPADLIGAVHQGYYFGSTARHAFRLRLPQNQVNRAKLNDYTLLSIRPTAWYVSPADRLYFADGRGVYEWAQGADRKPLLHRGSFCQPGSYRLRFARLIQECGFNSRLVMYRSEPGCASSLVFDGAVTGGETLGVDLGKPTGCFEYEITGTAEVKRAQWAPSPADLPKVF